MTDVTKMFGEIKNDLTQIKDLKDFLKNIISDVLGVYNSKQVQEILDVSKKTLQGYRDENQINFTQVGSKIWYTKKNIEDFLNRFAVN